MMDNVIKLALKMIRAHDYFYYVNQVPEPQQMGNVLFHIEKWERKLQRMWEESHADDEDQYCVIIKRYFENSLRLFYVYDVLLHPKEWERLQRTKAPQESTMQLRMQECPASMEMLIKYKMELCRGEGCSVFREYINTNKADPDKLLQSMHTLIDGNTQEIQSNVIRKAVFFHYLKRQPSSAVVRTEFPSFKKFRKVMVYVKGDEDNIEFGDVKPQQGE